MTPNDTPADRLAKALWHQLKLQCCVLKERANCAVMVREQDVTAAVVAYLATQSAVGQSQGEEKKL